MAAPVMAAPMATPMAAPMAAPMMAAPTAAPMMAAPMAVASPMMAAAPAPAAPTVVVVNKDNGQDSAADSTAMTLFCLGFWLFPPLLFCAAANCNHKSSGARCWGRAAVGALVGWVLMIILLAVLIAGARSAYESLGDSDNDEDNDAGTSCQASSCGACRSQGGCGWCEGWHSQRWGGDKCAPGNVWGANTHSNIGCGWGRVWKADGGTW